MAALDRKLRRGEEFLAGMESACERFCRFACGLMPRGWMRREGEKEAGETGRNPSANPAGV
jgi:hypothetical protein